MSGLLVLLIMVVTISFVFIVPYQIYRFVNWMYSKDKILHGRLPKNLLFNSRNHLLIYVCYSVWLIRQNREESGRKLLFLKNFLIKEFQGNYFDFTEYLSNYLNHKPVPINDLCSYLNKNITFENEKKKVIHFMVGLAFIDGIMNKNEYKIILEVNTILGLNVNELEQLIEDYTPKQKKETLKDNVISSDYAFSILELELNADLTIIKKQYKQLVKKYHPDLFSESTIEEQERVHIQFIKIQKAYEKLIKKFDNV